MAYAIKVIYDSGDEEFLCEGFSDRPARFHSLNAAKKQRDFMKMGMDDECQSINVVPYPQASPHPSDG